MASDAPKLKYVPFYHTDWETDQDVTLMTDRQQIWYWRLLVDQWRHESLPDDELAWYALAKPRYMSPDDREWEAFLDIVRRKFPLGRDGRRRNGRMAEERSHQIAVYKARAAAGRRSAEVRQ